MSFEDLEDDDLVKVHVDRSYEYPLNESQRRALPVGWTGSLPFAVAKELSASGFGRITGVVEDAADENADTSADGSDGNPSGDGNVDPGAGGSDDDPSGDGIADPGAVSTEGKPSGDDDGVTSDEATSPAKKPAATKARK